MGFKTCNSFKDYLKEIGYRLDIEILNYHFDNGFLCIQYNDLIKHYKDSVTYNASSIYESINIPDELSILRKPFCDETIEEWKINGDSEYMKLKTFDFLSCEIRYDEEKLEEIVDNLKKIFLNKRNITQGDDLKMLDKNKDMKNPNGVVLGGTVNNVNMGMGMSMPNFNAVGVACNGMNGMVNSNFGMNNLMMAAQPVGGMMGNGMMTGTDFYSVENQEPVMISQRFHIDFMTSKHILHLIKNYIVTSQFKYTIFKELLGLNKNSLIARTKIYQKETESIKEIIHLNSNENFISEYKNKIEELNSRYAEVLEIQNKTCKALELVRENSDLIGLTIFSDILSVVYKLNDPNLNVYLIEYANTQNKLYLEKHNINTSKIPNNAACDVGIVHCESKK